MFAGGHRTVSRHTAIVTARGVSELAAVCVGIILGLGIAGRQEVAFEVRLGTLEIFPRDHDDFTPVAAPQVHNPFFWGGYLAASRVLAGDARHFDRDRGYYTSVKPPKPGLFKGGWGGWEVGTRYTYTDLSSGTIDGGRMGRWTTGLSWYPSGTWRLEANYGLSFLVRGGITGCTHGLSGRIQWSLGD